LLNLTDNAYMIFLQCLHKIIEALNYASPMAALSWIAKWTIRSSQHACSCCSRSLKPKNQSNNQYHKHPT